MERSFAAIAPGRLCLFGEHQDYLGFPVIALALPLLCCRIDVTVALTEDVGRDSERTDDHIVINLQLPEALGGESREYDLEDLPPSPPGSRQDGKDYDFALAAIHEVLKERKKSNGSQFTDTTGVCGNNDKRKKVHVQCTSSIGELPLRAGCSSSTAFVTAFVMVLKQIFDDQHNRRLRENSTGTCSNSSNCKGENSGDGNGAGNGHLLELAKLAHRAEVTHFGNPGGTMDHVAIAFGSFVETKENGHDVCSVLRIGPDPWEVELLPMFPPFDSSNGMEDDKDNGVWILGYSGEPKDTIKHLKRCKYDRIELLQKKLKGDWDHPIVVASDDCDGNDGSRSQERSTPTPTLSEAEQALRKATISNRDTEEKAAKLWRSYCGSQYIPQSKNESLGHSLARLMKKHHESLRDGLDLSTPRLEAMNQAALDAGAWGFKVVGSGGGGCGVAWAPSFKAMVVSDAMENVGGAEKTWIIKNAGRGARIISTNESEVLQV